MSLKGKIALITAAGSGIAKKTALCFAKSGARLFICDINPETLSQTETELKTLGAEVHSAVYDGGSTDSIRAMFEEHIKQYGDIDVLVNITGIAGPTKPMDEVTLDEWNDSLAVNLTGTFYLTQLAVPYMKAKKSGKIVNMSSQTGKRPLVNRIPYCTTKIGIIGMTRCLAEELGAYNINVNSICPYNVGGARIEMLIQREIERTGKTRDEILAGVTATSFIKRQVKEEDIANTIAFLCDDELSSSITGQDVNINCGLPHS